MNDHYLKMFRIGASAHFPPWYFYSRYLGSNASETLSTGMAFGILCLVGILVGVIVFLRTRD
jgi:hypothetical protein